MNTTVVANAKKPIDIAKQGLNSVKNNVVKKNLQGVSESMSKKGWKDSQGRSGKVGVVSLRSHRLLFEPCCSLYCIDGAEVHPLWSRSYAN